MDKLLRLLISLAIMVAVVGGVDMIYQLWFRKDKE